MALRTCAVRLLKGFAFGAAVALCHTIPGDGREQKPTSGATDRHAFSEMRWRSIGPHRASRTVAAAGHRSHPYTFYMAQVNGGVWKTTDAGRMPWPKEEPTGENPPDGATIDYYLSDIVREPVTLEISDATGRIVRRYSSADPVARIPDAANAPLPLYWYRPPRALAATPGFHRFIWDVHYQSLPDPPGGGGGFGGRGGLPIQAIPRNTAPAPTTPSSAVRTRSVPLAGSRVHRRTREREQLFDLSSRRCE